MHSPWKRRYRVDMLVDTWNGSPRHVCSRECPIFIYDALFRGFGTLFFLLVLLSMRSGNKDWKCSACSFVPNWDMLASWNSETMNNKWAAPVPLHLGCWPWLWGSGKTTVFWQKFGLVSAVLPQRDSNISSYWILVFSMWSQSENKNTANMFIKHTLEEISPYDGQIGQYASSKLSRSNGTVPHPWMIEHGTRGT